jgi:hypothetical protein
MNYKKVIRVLKERSMRVSPYAGKSAEQDILVNVPKLITDYFAEVPNPAEQLKP